MFEISGHLPYFCVCLCVNLCSISHWLINTWYYAKGYFNSIQWVNKNRSRFIWLSMCTFWSGSVLVTQLGWAIWWISYLHCGILFFYWAGQGLNLCYTGPQGRIQGWETSGLILISGLRTSILSMKFHFHTCIQFRSFVSKVFIWVNICLK